MVTMIRSDLDFILAQIKIAEADARGEPLLGTYIPNSELPWGLRRVDGSNNNLTPGQSGYGAADQPFPNAVDPVFINEGDDGMAFGPPIMGAGGPVDFGFLKFPGLPAGPNNPPLPFGYIPDYAKFGGQGVTAVPGGFNSPNGTFIPGPIQPNYLVNTNYAVFRDPGTSIDTANDPSLPARAIQPGDVVDADPRIISNLIVDPTANNAAAV